MSEESESLPAEAEAQTGTDPDIKASLQELIKHGYLEEARKPALFRHAVVHEAALNRSLEPLDLALLLDTARGLALLVLPDDRDSKSGDDWSHPLVRRQRLTLEQSLIVAFLREAFLLHEQERGVGQSLAKLPIDDLLPKFLTYFQSTNSDNRDRAKLKSILDQLKTHGIVSEIDKNDEIVIRPLIVHLANADSLKALLQTFQSLTEPES